MRLTCLPGISIAVIRDRKVVWTKVAGVTNVDTKELVQETTLFEAASASKPVFAYAVLQYADQRKLELDRPLSTYFVPPYFPDDARIKRITARHVLTHSSGFVAWGDETKPDTLKPVFEPGEFFSYNGEGFFWLQLVIEKLAGCSLDRFMRTQLFEPAGMAHSSFMGDAQQAQSAAWGHVGGKLSKDQGWRNVLGRITPIADKWQKPIRDWTQDDWLKAGAEIVPNAPPKRIRFSNSAASMLTTASDYAKFLTLAMEHSGQQPWEVSQVTRRAMISPQIAVQKGDPLWWGLGWCVEKWPAGWLVSHEGNNDNRATSYAGFDPANGNGIVVLANAGSGYQIYPRIVRSSLGYDPLSFIANLNPPHDR
jgi:CubicO group peptidase (beta-lactamase class C family)